MKDRTRIQDIPSEELTPEICLEAVKKDGLLLGSIPIEHRTLQICYEAFDQNLNAIRFVPKEILDVLLLYVLLMGAKNRRP